MAITVSAVPFSLCVSHRFEQAGHLGDRGIPPPTSIPARGGWVQSGCSLHPAEAAEPVRAEGTSREVQVSEPLWRTRGVFRKKWVAGSLLPRSLALSLAVRDALSLKFGGNGTVSGFELNELDVLKSLTAKQLLLLKNELDDIATKWLNNENLEESNVHYDWYNGFKDNYRPKSFDDAKAYIYELVGSVCENVLRDAGVYKEDEAGREGLKRFISACGFEV